MGSLVVCAGDKSNGRFLSEVWLPGLRGAGCYLGDVLLLDYDFSEQFRDELLSGGRVFVEAVDWGERLVPVWGLRHRDLLRLLPEKYGGYDVVLCVDGDVRFLLPVAPLLEMAHRDFCCVRERVTGWMWERAGGFPGAEEVWRCIRDEWVVNAGMYVGPEERVLEAERFMWERCQVHMNDQTWLNALIYCEGFPVKRVSEVWNFSRSYGPKVVGGALCTPEGEPVAIYHEH